MWTDFKAELFDDFGMEAGSHSLTLGRLYAWEKKLYQEVKVNYDSIILILYVLFVYTSYVQHLQVARIYLNQWKFLEKLNTDTDPASLGVCPFSLAGVPSVTLGGRINLGFLVWELIRRPLAF